MITERISVSPTTQYEVQLHRGLTVAEFDTLANNEQSVLDLLRQRPVDQERKNELIRKTRADQLRIIVAMIKSIRLMADGESPVAINSVDDLTDARIILALQGQLLIPKV